MAMKILIRLPNWVGDVVMATPFLRAVRANAPGAEIVLQGKQAMRDLLAGLPYHDRYLDLSGGVWAQGRDLRRERFDLAILCPNSLGSALSVWLGRARRRVGYALQGRSWLLTDPIAIPKDAYVRTRWGTVRPVPMNRYYAGLLAPLGWDPGSLKLELTVTAEHEEVAARFRKEHGLEGTAVVAFAPGASFGPSKLWVEERWARLAERLRDALGLKVLIVGGPAEAPLLERIAAAATVPVATTASVPNMSLGLMKSLLAPCKLLVTTDSGPRHVGAALGLPTVVLMGPNHPGYSDTGHTPNAVIQEKLDCVPCQKKVCPLGHHDCMKRITVERVEAEVRKLLGESAPRPTRTP